MIHPAERSEQVVPTRPEGRVRIRSRLKPREGAEGSILMQKSFFECWILLIRLPRIGCISISHAWTCVCNCFWEVQDVKNWDLAMDDDIERWKDWAMRGIFVSYICGRETGGEIGIPGHVNENWNWRICGKDYNKYGSFLWLPRSFGARLGRTCSLLVQRIGMWVRRSSVRRFDIWLTRVSSCRQIGRHSSLFLPRLKRSHRCTYT